MSVIVSVAELIVSPVEVPDTVTLSPVPSSSVSSVGSIENVPVTLVLPALSVIVKSATVP